jgi:hypothetical protein
MGVLVVVIAISDLLTFAGGETGREGLKPLVRSLNRSKR